MTKEPKKTAKRWCYACNNLILGAEGVDFQMVKSRGETRYYCEKCVKKLLRGE